MAVEHGGEQAPPDAAAPDGETGPESSDVLESVPLPREGGESESKTTVLVAFAANILIARGQDGRRRPDRLGVAGGRGGALLG